MTTISNISLEDLLYMDIKPNNYYELVRNFKNKDFKILKEKLPQYYSIINELHIINRLKPHEIYKYAGKTSNLKLLKYVVENGFCYYKTALHFVKDINCFIYAVENGFKIDEHTIIYAIKWYDCIDILKYCIKTNVKLPRKVLAYTVKNCRIKCYDYLIQIGFKHNIFDLSIITSGKYYGNNSMIQMSLNHGCKFDHHHIFNILRFNNIKLLYIIFKLSPELFKDETVIMYLKQNTFKRSISPNFLNSIGI